MFTILGMFLLFSCIVSFLSIEMFSGSIHQPGLNERETPPALPAVVDCGYCSALKKPKCTCWGRK
jgi:hypothetical protein